MGDLAAQKYVTMSGDIFYCYYSLRLTARERRAGMHCTHGPPARLPQCQFRGLLQGEHQGARRRGRRAVQNNALHDAAAKARERETLQDS